MFGGVPGRGIYDNMKTAVDRVGRGKERQVNARFLAMASHYVFEPEFCNPAAGWEKGQVEKNVQDSRHRLWQPMPEFPDIAALNVWLERRCMELWHEISHGALPGSVADVWAVEQAALMPLPPAFDSFVEHSKRVSPTCLISFERNRYSVPASFANLPVSLRVYPDRLVVAAEGNILCEHGRVIQRSHRCHRRRSMIGGTTLLSSSANPGPCAMARHFWNYLQPLGSYKITCCANRVAIARWSISRAGPASR